MDSPGRLATTQWRLFSAPTSPFVRKVRIVALERGLHDRLLQTPCDPYEEQPDFVAVNPIAQVPALIAGGQYLTGSALICAWLDGQGDEGPRLIPEGAAQWEVRAREAVADGVLECGVRLRSEGRRDPSERSPKWIERWVRGVQRGFDRLEETLPDEAVFDLGVITAVCAATYIGFRHPHIDWKAGRPRLAERVGALERRPSFERTHPSKPL